MTQIALTGGSYKSRDVSASCQRCVNLYPEQLPPHEGEPVPMTYLPTPGLTYVTSAPNSHYPRCLYAASDGELYGVWGRDVYHIDKKYNFTKLGSFKQNSRHPVSMTDNGTYLIMSDGSKADELREGYTVKMKHQTDFKYITEDGWLGSAYLDYTDTFFVANYIGTPTFFISGSNDITFDALDFAGKSAKPDPLKAAIVSHRVIWLIGEYSTEIWYNTGGGGLGTTTGGQQTNTFPFEIMPGVLIEDGCAATYSIAKTDTMIFWLGQNKTGGRYVIQGSGYKTSRVSTHALEQVWDTYARVDDAVGFCYTQNGHYFYVLNFPYADKTWVYDIHTQLWHERVWIDPDGGEHRHRAGFHAFWNGMNLVADWENGNIYKFDLSNFTDNGYPVKRLRSFPQEIDNQNNSRLIYRAFTADLSSGQEVDPNLNPEISLRWSDDRGFSWSDQVRQNLGKQGNYRANLNWNRLGMSRYRVFELEWAASAQVSLHGAFVEYSPVGS